MMHVFRPAKAVWFIQSAHNDESDTRCLRCTIAQQRRRQTGLVWPTSRVNPIIGHYHSV